MLNIKYVAGLFDGEGHVTINCQTLKSGWVSLRITVGITNIHLPILEQLKEDFGGCIVTTKWPKQGWQTSHQWKLSTCQGVDFLMRIVNDLIIKKRVALLAINIQKNYPRQTGPKVSLESNKKWMECRKEIMQLNGRNITLLN